jgi:RHS repeat-associated protein
LNNYSQSYGVNNPFVETYYQQPASATTNTILQDVGLTSQTVTALNPSGTPSLVQVWDYYSGSAPSTPTEATSYTYYGVNGGSFPAQVTIKDGSGNEVSQTTYSYDQSAPATTTGLPNHNSVSGNRGNATSVSQVVDSSGATLAQSAAYDDAGTLLTSTNSNGTTTYGHDSTDTFVTSTTFPIPSSGITIGTSATYDFSSGFANYWQDPNQKQTIYYYDSLSRPQEVDFPDGGKTTLGYTPTQTSVHQYQNSAVYSDTETLYDSYGRVSRVAIANGQTNGPWYQNDTCYDTTGRPNFNSYQYQGNGWTTPKVCSVSGDASSYDALSRVNLVTHADNTAINYSYKGRAQKTTDEYGVSRISQVDALGRPTAICEVSSSTFEQDSPSACPVDLAANGFGTVYAYSLANHSTTITQGVQTRFFQTDFLGRKTQTQEPESGITNYRYTYNSTGLQVTRTRPQANQPNPLILTTTTYQYDVLERILSATYTDGTPPKSYAYDTNAWNWTDFTPTNLKGRLYLAYNSSAPAATVYSYDAIGRINQMDECLPSGCGTTAYNKHLSYSYDWTGNLISETDDANGTITYPRSPAGEITSVTNQTYNLIGGAGPAALVSNKQNGPFGTTVMAYGNGLNSPYSYDSNGHLSGGWVCSGTAATYCSGGTQLYGFVDTAVGQYVTAATDTIVNEGASFNYDQLGRLQSQTYGYGGVNTGLSFTYDRYGNRWQQSATSGSAPGPNYTFSKSNNQSMSFIYDAAGNMTNDAYFSYTYDAEGNITAVNQGNIAQYKYDALNHRVLSQTSGGTVEDVFDAHNNIASLWSASTHSMIEGHIFADSQQIALRGGDNNTYFVHRNWIDTDRVHTGPTGSVVATWSSLPFGDGGIPTGSGSGAADFSRFGNMDYNSESKTYQAQFRQYNETSGRWMSPDPYAGSYDASNPQTFNRDAYVTNSPLSFNDPTGLQSQSGCSRYGDSIPCPTDWLPAFFGAIAGGIESLFGFDHPAFHGTMQNRPSGDVQISNTNPNSGNVKATVTQGPILSSGNGTFTMTVGYSVPVFTPSLPVIELPSIPWEQIGAGLAAFARAVPAVAASVLLLNMKGDNTPNPNRCQEVRQRAIAVCTDLHLDGMRDNSGPFFSCIRERMAAEGCGY